MCLMYIIQFSVADSVSKDQLTFHFRISVLFCFLLCLFVCFQRQCERNTGLVSYEFTEKLFTVFLRIVLQSIHPGNKPSGTKPLVVGSISEEGSANLLASVRTIANILFRVSCIISILYIDILLTLSALQMSCHTG